ncbi:unnamed protein product [Pieris macdunnoughi]|uniref:Peptidase M12B propeptide domain-containing protein n=1 Tax=Pieris macdunnoughi TaxID=345717 RepID=A0A821PZS8_9NEOP|nr:unnamed protein product [Pieris macdunnoughi]
MITLIGDCLGRRVLWDSAICIPTKISATNTRPSASRRLSEYVENYEEVHYNHDEVHLQHLRARRSVDPPDLRINFDAHGRRFNLRLRRDLSAFSDDFKVHGSQGELHDVDTSHLYTGEVSAASLVQDIDSTQNKGTATWCLNETQICLYV